MHPPLHHGVEQLSPLNHVECLTQVHGTAKDISAIADGGSKREYISSFIDLFKILFYVAGINQYRLRQLDGCLAKRHKLIMFLRPLLGNLES